MSLDVVLDIIRTLRIIKTNEISEEKDTNCKVALSKELEVLTPEEYIASRVMPFHRWEIAREAYSLFQLISVPKQKN